ncbi:MAG TPA: protein kinase [Gemmatimonadaceae bacterium]|nr:protein kinase [Gemmatimonadaceae bacterium]
MTMTPTSRLDSLRAVLGPSYQIDRELGAGGMAAVYLAHDLKHDRRVAIKVLHPDLAQSLGRERFVREIRLAARLNHPHILPLYDSGEAVDPADATGGSFLYFVMPVMEGQTLRDRLRHGRPLPVDDALRIATEVADALDYAHRHDIVHRDIKPENILLHEGHAIVADFGIGKALVAAAENTPTFTQIGVTVGTPAYMSPEQAAGDTVDGRSDLFALGCVLYEMLTGEVAFSGPTAPATIAKRFVYSPPPVTSARADVSAEVGEIVTRLLGKAPADRFATGAEVVATLRASPTVSGPRAAASRPTESATEKSIAVLPFTNMSADADNEFFSDGLTEELITDLSGVKSLRVTSRNSSMQFKATTKTPPEIGRALGVRYLLTGSVRKAGSALRITAQLVDADKDTPLWAEKYSGTMDDVFDVQERVSRAIVGALQVTLTTSEDVRLAARPIQNPRAFELYLQARAEMRRFGVSLEHASMLLDRAVAIEGNSPPLRALRAFMEFSKVRGGTATDLRPLDVAESEARALIELVPDAPYGHALLGFVAYERGQLKEAARHLTRAMELDPADADVLFMLTITIQAAGQIEAARELARQFHEVDPLSPFSGAMLCVCEWFSGCVGTHLDALERALSLDPENPIIRWALGYTYALMGRFDDASVQVQWLVAHTPELSYTTQLSALLDAVEGQHEAALAALARVDRAALDSHHTFHLSESVAMAGDTGRALELLDWAVDHGFYPVRFIAEFCPFMVPLRGLPEFDRIVAKAARRVAAFTE